MHMFRLGFALAGVFISGIAAFVGLAVTILSLQSGEIGVTMAPGTAGAMVSRLTDPDRYWTNLAIFGLGPVVLGASAAAYAWHRLKSG